jgi:DEAD/DEAH box helicase domain-containing protein
MPPDQLRTVAYWVTINDDTVDLLREDGLWQGDKNDYGANWPVQRQRALDRDHYTCQNCGLVGSKTPLHVHHKIPFRQFPGWLQANQMDNLITLCPTCHRKAETLIKMRSGIYGLGYALSQLAPLFVMCDASDLGCIPEVKSDVADGKPAVILFDQVPAGIGLSQALFQQHNQLMAAALELVSNCGCTDGCPSCIGPAGPEGQGGKKETLALLKSLNGMPVKSGQDNGITF